LPLTYLGMQGTIISKLFEMKHLFERQLLVLANQSKNLTFYLLKKNKGCWHKQPINLHLLTIWASNLAILTWKFFSSTNFLNFIMLILVNLIWFQCLLLLLLGFIKVFARSSRLTLPCVLLIDLGLLLTTQLLMLLWLSKNLFIIVLLLLISLYHIYYSFILNLNGGFLMMFDSLLL